MPLTTDICRTGSPNFFIRGPHKLLHNIRGPGIFA